MTVVRYRSASGEEQRISRVTDYDTEDDGLFLRVEYPARVGLGTVETRIPMNRVIRIDG